MLEMSIEVCKYIGVTFVILSIIVIGSSILRGRFYFIVLGLFFLVIGVLLLIISDEMRRSYKSLPWIITRR